MCVTEGEEPGNPSAFNLPPQFAFVFNMNVKEMCMQNTQHCLAIMFCYCVWKLGQMCLPCIQKQK